VPLRQRTALITGGTRGIGKGIAQGLAAEGVRIALSYRSNKTAAQNALRQLQSLGAECFAVQADAANPEQVEILLNTVIERYGRLDILVNNVGEFNWKPVSETTISEWQDVISSNLLSVFLACKAALTPMRKQRKRRLLQRTPHDASTIPAIRERRAWAATLTLRSSNSTRTASPQPWCPTI